MCELNTYTGLPPEMENDLGVVLRNCQHLSSMIDDVLDLTRVEAGKVRLHQDWIRLAEIVTEAVNAVRPLVEKKNLFLHVDVPNDLPDVYCDKTRIRQVVLNLISNAARFTEKGSISIKVGVSNGYIITRVTDTGPGVSAADIDRIFEPFSQGDTGFWRDKAGSGLGLAISQQFVNLHQGQLWVESESGAGSSFLFKLPILQPMEHVISPGHFIREDWIWREAAFRTEGAGVADQVRKPRILLSDTVGSLYQEIERFTNKVDLIDLSEFSNSGEIVQNYPADLILINSEKSVDPLFSREIIEKSFPGTLLVQCHVPSPKAQSYGAGASDYLVKPVSGEMLENAIRSIDHPVRRILVVDDDPGIRDLYTRMLCGYDGVQQVITAVNGEDAILKVEDSQFDMVLLDLVMPDMDGWAWLTRVRQTAQLVDLPVFIVSAQDPADEPPRTPYMLVSAANGFSVKRLLRCSLELSQLLLEPEGALDPTPLPIDGDGSVSREMQQRPEPVPDSLL